MRPRVTNEKPHALGLVFDMDGQASKKLRAAKADSAGRT